MHLPLISDYNTYLWAESSLRRIEGSISTNLRNTTLPSAMSFDFCVGSLHRNNNNDDNDNLIDNLIKVQFFVRKTWDVDVCLTYTNH